MFRLLTQLLRRCMSVVAIALVALVLCGDLCFNVGSSVPDYADSVVAGHGLLSPAGHLDPDHSEGATGCCDTCLCVDQSVVTEPSHFLLAVEWLARRLRPPSAVALESVVRDIDLPPVIA